MGVRAKTSTKDKPEATKTRSAAPKVKGDAKTRSAAPKVKGDTKTRSAAPKVKGDAKTTKARPSRARAATAKARNVPTGFRPVILTTKYRGIFFGYADRTDCDPIDLKGASMALSWGADNYGVIGLARFGPIDGSVISASADMSVRKITGVIEVSKEAEFRWCRMLAEIDAKHPLSEQEKIAMGLEQF